MILASDGVWDGVSNEEATATVEASLRRGEDPTAAATSLCKLSALRGTDDISVIVLVWGCRNLMPVVATQTLTQTQLGAAKSQSTFGVGGGGDLARQHRRYGWAPPVAARGGYV